MTGDEEDEEYEATRQDTVRVVGVDWTSMEMEVYLVNDESSLNQGILVYEVNVVRSRDVDDLNERET